MNKILIICGPTATGKTALALSLAIKFNGELVNADSRQVYREMDIGTGKDMPKNFQFSISNFQCKIKEKAYDFPVYVIDGVPVWMYDVVNPDEEFSVSHYEAIAHRVITDIQSRGKLPIIVGGTGLYVSAVGHQLQTLHIPPDPQLRQKAVTMSLSSLQQLVEREDPVAWKTMNVSDRQNPRRLIRKLEISAYNKLNHSAKRILPTRKSDSFTIGLSMPLPKLYARIDARVDKRVIEGVEQEVRSLVNKGYGWDLPSMSGLGYREWKPYFQIPNVEKEKIIQQWKFDEHAYSRRQMTWFKKRPSVHWFDVGESGYEKRVESIVAAWYTGNR